MKKRSHLDDKQIIEAVIDERALDGVLRRHLLECAACRAQKEALQGSLENFTRISRAETLARFGKPVTSVESVHPETALGLVRGRKRALPGPKPLSAGVFGAIWQPRTALGLAVAFVALVLLLTPLTFKKDKIFTKDVVYREMIQDQRFMAEIEKLENNPLPRFYVDLGDPDEGNSDVKSPDTTKHGSPTQGGGSGNA